MNSTISFINKINSLEFWFRKYQDSMPFDSSKTPKTVDTIKI